MARRTSGLAEASKIQRIAPLAEMSTQPAATERSAPAGRTGKAMVAGWFDKAAVKQLRLIAVNHETSMQEQLGRALNLLFREEGMPALAQIEREDVAT